jgi:hypothetical protein
LLLTLPPSSMFLAGRQGRGWLCVFSNDLRCFLGLVMADDRAVDRPSRLVPGPSDWRLTLLFPLSPCPPRLDLPVATLPLVRPVLRSVRRLLCATLHPMSVLPYGAAAGLLVITRDALLAPLCLLTPPLVVAVSLLKLNARTNQF